jgi:anti-sigma B factor antagonist
VSDSSPFAASGTSSCRYEESLTEARLNAHGPGRTLAFVPILDARVSVSRFGTDSFVVAAGGELDLFTSERLRAKLADVLELGGRRILVDLTGVSFMDSTALGVLVGTAKTLRSSGGQMVLVADDPRVTRAIEITGLAQVLRIESSVPEAVQQLVERTND